MEKISGHTNESIVYPLNRAIVREMLHEALLKGVEADKVFKKAPQIELPTFKFYTHELDKKVVKDKALALDLKKTAALTKADEIAFDSLAAAALATKDVEIIREYWLSDRGLVSIRSAIIAGISVLVTVILI